MFCASRALNLSYEHKNAPVSHAQETETDMYDKRLYQSSKRLLGQHLIAHVVTAEGIGKAAEVLEGHEREQ